jgi:hypothetical protein
MIRGGALTLGAAAGTTFDPFTASFAGGAPTRILGCTGQGLHAEGPSGSVVPIQLAIDGAEIGWNGAAGVWISKLPDGSAASVRHADIHSNGPSPYFTGRTAGALVLASMAVPSPGKLPLTFQGNLIRNNAGDQLGLYVTGAVALDGGSCTQDPNVFACLDNVRYEVYATSSATATAWSTLWATNPPIVSGSVDWSNYCTLPTGVTPPPCPPASPP